MRGKAKRKTVEKAAENDLKRLPTTTFRRIIPQIRTLALKIQDLQDAANLPAQKTIGELELEIFGSFTRFEKGGSH